MNKRDARRRVRADLLDTLSMTALDAEFPAAADRHGLTEAECLKVAERVADVLYRMALRADPG